MKRPIVLSLCDRTGNMVRPWAEHGFECWIVDLQHPEGIHQDGNIVRVGADILTWQPPEKLMRKAYVIFAFPPCTHLAVSGACWFQRKGIGKLIEALTLVERCRKICEMSQGFWMLENPVSTLSTYWRKPDYTFNPHEYGGYLAPPGDAYTKRTCLWTGGSFVMPPKKSVEPVEGSKMSRLPPSPDRSNLRSVTPIGFAVAVFQANKEQFSKTHFLKGKNTMEILKIKVSKLKAHPENGILLPPLSEEEKNGLWGAMLHDFCPEYPFEVLKNGGNYIVLDGNNRREILQENGIDVEVTCICRGHVKDWPIEKQRSHIEDCNLRRRNLTKEAKIEIAKRRAARGHNQESIAQTVGMSQQWVSNHTTEVKQARQEAEQEAVAILRDSGKTQQEVAETLEIPQRTVSERDVSENTKNGISAKQKNVEQQAKEITSEEEILKRAAKIRQEQRERGAQEAKNKPIKPLPEGVYDVILADYATLEDVKSLQVPSATDAVLFLWATVSMIREALVLMAAWGFEYRTQAVWIKDKFGNGYYFRCQHELLLVGVKGKVPAPAETDRPSSIIEAPRLSHSEKPDVVYGLIEQMYPGRKYLELFARREHEGWKSWGNEITL